MASKTIVTLTDDLDGGEADESIAFSFRGVGYEIDLSAKNAASFEKALAKFLDAGRRAPKAKATARRSSDTGPTEDLGAIRAWARDNGFEVADRGRISAEIRAAYEAAN